MRVKRYRKKPVVIEALLFTGDNTRECVEFLGMGHRGLPISDDLLIATREGTMRAVPGDYIIKGVAGEFYPCKPDIFDQTYALDEGN